MLKKYPDYPYEQPHAPEPPSRDQIPPHINPETGKPWEENEKEKPGNDRVIIINPNDNDGWTDI